jgi:hypothetical protein
MLFYPVRVSELAGLEYVAFEHTASSVSRHFICFVVIRPCVLGDFRLGRDRAPTMGRNRLTEQTYGFVVTRAMHCS